ncbi:DUF2938 domain-containing protein [Pantoea sp. FN0302]|uniref:DUF2938 domain-containing protein n=1 Tax=unclassified Pantoea TaxID=2630326 RepID=UPI003CEDABE8
MENLVLDVIATGIGATAVMDVWGFSQRRFFSVPSLDYALVGRALLWLRHGKWVHCPIMSTPPHKGEKLVGWLIHYVTGIVFAALLIMLTGKTWLYQPTLAPALLTGMLTLCFPFFIMQPMLGFGIAAAKTASPARARLRSLMTHLVFGMGLYFTALVLSWLK